MARMNLHRTELAILDLVIAVRRGAKLPDIICPIAKQHNVNVERLTLAYGEYLKENPVSWPVRYGPTE